VKTITNKTQLSSSTCLQSIAVIGSAIALLSSTAAFAQDVPVEESAEAIIITGSRIARPDLEVSSPVNVISQDEIALKQNVSAEELLRDLPGLRPSTGPGVNNGTDGSSSVDLRGIGAERTLVLLDGKRVVPFGLDGLTDLNAIPIALVSRVDVVTGGASSVYGADAVAGVVNFVIRRDFSGVEASASYRFSERGDAAARKGDLVIGGNIADGRGNVVLALGYTKVDQLNQNTRPFGVAALSTVTGTPQGSQTAVPSFLLGPVVAGASGPLGSVYDTATGLFRTATDPDTYNFNPSNLYQTPLERYSVFAQASYEITPAIEVYAQAMFNRSIVASSAAPSGTFTNPYLLPLSNPYLSAGARTQLCAAGGAVFTSGTGVRTTTGLTPAQCVAAGTANSVTSPDYQEVAVTLARRFVEYGDRFQSFESNQFQAMFGLRGDIAPTLKYDISAQYGETLQNQTRQNWGSYSRVQQAMRAFTTTTCSNTTNGCVPINLFGPAGSITPAMIGFFALDAFIKRKVKQTVVTASVSGDLFGLTSPGASNPAAFSIGAEYRKLSAQANPDAASQIQSEVLGTGARIPTDFGEYSVKEAFGEIIVPLVEDVTFIKNLTVEAGIRYSDYTTTGASTTWKAGGIWEPVDGVKLRGMYQRAVRSPNIQELYRSPVTGLSNLTVDPCQAALPVGNAQLTALCVATGAPSTSIGFIPQPSAGQINATTAGNRLLNVERSRSITLGVVIAPPQIRNLSLTVDYFDIVVKNAITQPAQGDILNGCYSTALNPSQTFNGFCQLVGRNPINGGLNGAGETLGVVLGYSNLGIIDTSGVDATLRYKTALSSSTDAGEIGFSITGSYLDHWNFQANPLAINRDCTGYYSTNCTNPRIKWKINTRVTYSKGPFDVSLYWRHLSGVAIEPAAPAPRPALTVPQTGGPALTTIFDAYEKIPAYDYFDLALRAAVGEHLELTLTANNLFNKLPPIVGSGAGGTSFNSGNTFPTTYDVLGRMFTIGARMKF
jgi:iron complex outermembrane recepter protein